MWQHVAIDLVSSWKSLKVRFSRSLGLQEVTTKIGAHLSLLYFRMNFAVLQPSQKTGNQYNLNWNQDEMLIAIGCFELSDCYWLTFTSACPYSPHWKREVPTWSVCLIWLCSFLVLSPVSSLCVQAQNHSSSGLTQGSVFWNTTRSADTEGRKVIKRWGTKRKSIPFPNNHWHVNSKSQQLFAAIWVLSPHVYTSLIGHKHTVAPLKPVKVEMSSFLCGKTVCKCGLFLCLSVLLHMCLLLWRSGQANTDLDPVAVWEYGIVGGNRSWRGLELQDLTFITAH